ncbi:hypothetical protein QUA56_31800 [Microcoleus sp. N3A4]|uniref:hypothetical protein n=1 Tax=Microcoleus sp. N3A4 TaxID=3055379 RepID=UPI002FCEDABF
MVEGRIAWLHSWAKGKRQKVVSPAGVPRELSLDRTFFFQTPPLRWAMEGAIRDFAPGQRFRLTSD